MSLKIAPNLTLPDDAVTETLAILAKRGAGKTYTSGVIVEEMLENHFHLAVIDPTGAWWGLRSSSTGKSSGYPVVILGGEHGDVPLEETAGETIADFLINEDVSVVLDLKEFRKKQAKRFVTDFAERLYQRNRAPLHLVVDEADLFAPQRVFKGEERMLGAFEDIVRRGRSRGLGCTLVTQRSAALNKDVLTQTECLIALRTTGPQDKAAIKAWIEEQGDPEKMREVLSSLPGLPTGTAWFWSPHWLGFFGQVKVRKKKTFDSSATPKVGQKVSKPKRMAEVNLEALKEKIADTIERKKADDPKELKKQISQLKAKLSKIPEPISPDSISAQRDSEWQARIQKVQGQLRDIYLKISDGYSSIGDASRMMDVLMDSLGDIAPTTLRLPDPHTNPVPVGARVGKVTANRIPPGYEDEDLSKAERAILSAIAPYSTRTRRQIGLLSGYSHTSGHFKNMIGSLRSKGYIDGSDPVVITTAGLDALGSYEPLPTGDALRQYWLQKLPKAAGDILRVCMNYYPHEVSRDRVGEEAGYSASSGHFKNMIGKLNTLELIEKKGGNHLIASEDLFQ